MKAFEAVISADGKAQWHVAKTMLQAMSHAIEDYIVGQATIDEQSDLLSQFASDCIDASDVSFVDDIESDNIYRIESDDTCDGVFLSILNISFCNKLFRVFSAYGVKNTAVGALGYSLINPAGRPVPKEEPMDVSRPQPVYGRSDNYDMCKLQQADIENGTFVVRLSAVAVSSLADGRLPREVVAVCKNIRSLILQSSCC